MFKDLCIPANACPVVGHALYKCFLDFFREVDVLICPAASVSPFPHSQLFVEEVNGEKMPTYMRWLALSYAPTMALACAAALPCGVDHGATVRHPGDWPQWQ
jgi:Asp-tRNA(Asn)/Glu-tRNA(Gln) amidotransferase A subunit family amidase